MIPNPGPILSGENIYPKVGRPWNRVDPSLQREFAREEKKGKLCFERKVELYGEKLEEKFKELEERLLCREEELLLKGRELQRLRAENYLLNCRVETISSSSKQNPRIFQSSPEHPNARIIITCPSTANTHPESIPGDRFYPQLPSNFPSRRPTFTGNHDGGGSLSDNELLDEYASHKRKKPLLAANQTMTITTASNTMKKRKRLKSKELSVTKKKDDDQSAFSHESSSKSNRENVIRLDRRENVELYEALQKQVTIDLLKQRHHLLIADIDYRRIPGSEQKEMVTNISRKLELENNADLVARGITSVQYWVAHKSWRLRRHFKDLGKRYKQQHRHEDWSNSLPPISAVKPLINQKEVELWLSQSLGKRLAERRMMSNPEIRRAFWIVFIGGFRYGIRVAYDRYMTNTAFQAAVESLDIFTKNFECPVNETIGYRGEMKVVKDDEEDEQLGAGEDSFEEFDWKAVEEILKKVQGS